MTSLYHEDFYGWTQEQAALLKSGSLHAFLCKRSVRDRNK